MGLDSPRGGTADLVERWRSHEIVDSTTVFEGLIFDVQRDRVDLGDGEVVTRDYIRHPGAVAVVALHPFDGVDHVMLIRQYRHAAHGDLWELPAGLLDVDGEPPWEAAARELVEEVDLVADEWHVLADDVSSPGILPETIRTFLARGLHDVPECDLHERDAEERGIEPLWVPLDDALDAVLAGSISNAHAVVGLLAAHASRSRGWASLREKDAVWPARDAQRRPAEGDRGAAGA
ncbi:NUDIX domain-containing protein [Terracoccus luteus]|uniref:ADP-ribose pyrophosphatase n=1 Tax=Terracoccus luteus TaxID=53356 RepID=A0A839Q0U1_9MICO|nr:NUDIX hydrolase [Terracoccus luteus]MBB2987875.1 ADP-ribose pyrophosphatase [Terracoccus luteus]MCP2173526.1 ADP-ribose pyrophosphatase [Terracoccus luteus]